MPQLDACSTGDQEVEGSIPAGSGNIISWRLIMEYFISLPLIQEVLAKECVQILINPLRGLCMWRKSVARLTDRFDMTPVG